FSYSATQLFSNRRWAITGEAGVFLDPFYSPGSDFIAIANTYICDLLARDAAGEAFEPYVSLYEQLYFSFYENTLPLYQDQYALFGDERVMPVKVIWDYTYYWALLAPLFFGGRLTDLPTLGRLRPLFEEASALNLAMQPLLREWGERNQGRAAPEPRLLDQFRIDWFREMNGQLGDTLDTPAFVQRITGNVARMRWLAVEILQRARNDHPDIDDHGLQERLGADADAAPSLLPVWYAAEGLAA